MGEGCVLAELRSAGAQPSRITTHTLTDSGAEILRGIYTEF